MAVCARPCCVVLLALLAAATFVLAGCDEVAYKPDRRERRTQPPAGAAAEGHGVGSADVREAIGASDPLPGEGTSLADPPRSDRDYVAKCDIYWKLYWVKRTLDAGRVPPELPAALTKIEKQNRDTDPDEKRDLTQGILRNLRDGVDAGRKDEQFRRAGPFVGHVPWGAGRFAVERAVRDSASYHSVARRREPMPADVQRAARLVGEYEDRFHASPHDVRRRAFEQARADTMRLGDMLGLAGRDPTTKAP